MESMAPDTEALCRCSRSTTRPFCNGAQAVIGMGAVQKAVRREEEEL